jgi:hypothetical protein
MMVSALAALVFAAALCASAAPDVAALNVRGR